MSRVAKSPVPLPQGVDVAINAGSIAVKGKKGELVLPLHAFVAVNREANALCFSIKANVPSREAWAIAGTLRVLVSNMITGVVQGFDRKLILVGVGYRVELEGRDLHLTLGLSHPVVYPVPEGVAVSVPTKTEIVLHAIDKQLLGQVAANIRAFRPPEPYKGKGIRYAEESIVLKEVKKK